MTALQTPADAHARPVADILATLGTSPGGLTGPEAAARLARHGPNSLPAEKPRPALLRLLAQFNSALIYFMLAGALAAAALSHWLDAGVILAVVVVNGVVGFLQEGRAESALNAIRTMIAPRASVLRDGLRISLDVADLVPGDVVLIEAGDRVPADLRLIDAHGLLIDEAALTGESLAAHKAVAPVAPEAALGDRRSMAYSGTLVAAGQGSGVVTATGRDSQIGRISTLLGEAQPLTTPLLRQINGFARRFTAVALGAAAVVFAFAVALRGFAWDQALIAVVALAVGLIPEGLPAVITITLAIGVQRMAGRRAVIRRLPAVETLGATSIICSDKTGTLTRNEMTLRRVVTADGAVLVEGAGYDPTGHGFSPAPVAVELLRTGLLCNDAELRPGRWTVEGDPMEGALIAAAIKAGLDPDVERRARRLDSLPFDAGRRFMATLHEIPGRGRVLLVKGAPERLLDMCASQISAAGPQPLDRAAWTSRIGTAASEGERVLAYAARPVPADVARIDPDQLAEGLGFLGITGFIDPPRPEAVAAIAECHAAGIAVRMITGDHAQTAAAIARQLGMAAEPRVLTGADLDALPAAGFAEAVAGADVFARTSPEHKLRIVRALQSQGNIVAMTGDGVNDAPSLKQADVGIAMGIKGTEAAKQAAEIVLMDDNFASIVAAVREGRTVHDNIRKVIAWTLPTNGGEALMVVLAILIGFALPMTPVQILWVNLILEATLGLVLAFEPTEPGVMARPPRRLDAGLLTPFVVWRILFVSLLFMGLSLGVMFWALDSGRDMALARSMVVNTLVVLEIFYLFNIRHLRDASFTLRGIRGTGPVLGAVAVVVAGQLAFTYLPAMNRIFGSRPLSLVECGIVLGVGLVFMAVLEMEKTLLRALFRARGRPRSARVPARRLP